MSKAQSISGVGAKLGISGTMEYLDKDGNVLKTVQVSGSIPLEDLNMSIDDAKALIDAQEKLNGSNDCE